VFSSEDEAFAQSGPGSGRISVGKGTSISIERTADPEWVAMGARFRYRLLSDGHGLLGSTYSRQHGYKSAQADDVSEPGLGDEARADFYKAIAASGVRIGGRFQETAPSALNPS
jgi:hypothetical protein